MGNLEDSINKLKKTEEGKLILEEDFQNVLFKNKARWLVYKIKDLKNKLIIWRKILKKLKLCIP